MSKYSQRIEAFEQNEKKKRRIFAVIIILLVLLFLGGMVIGAQRILSTEGTFDPYAVTAESPLASEGTAQTLLDELSASLGSATNPNEVKLSVYTDVDIPDESIYVDSGDENLVTQLKYIKQDILEDVKEYYLNYEGSFGDDFSNEVIPIGFSAAEVDDVQCFKGRLNDEGMVTDFDSLFYTLKFPETPFDSVEDTVLFKSFGMDVSEVITSAFIEDISAIADVKSAELTCNNFKINAQTDEKSRRISSISYCRGYTVSLQLVFKGDLAPLAEQGITFDFTASENHFYTWAGLRLSEHTVSLEKGDVKTVEAFKTADSEVEVTWVSSAPEIAHVDEKGYIKGKTESTQPVTITASFDYRGNTYTDTCIVYVRKPVTEISISEKALELSVGDTAALSASVKPSKATIKTVLWFTEDADIATVDENGTVTAVGAGSTQVYALSADGYYRSSCKVTVTE